MRKIGLFHPTILSGAVLVALAPSLSAQTSSPSDRLEEVVVRGQIQAFRGGVPLEETPQSVQIVDNDFLGTLGITQLDDALNLSGSIARQNNFGGMWDQYAIRGFAGDENLPGGYLINGFSGGRGYSGPRDSANIERIEIIKGPGSALYGRSEPGGTVNLVTKKPEFEKEGYVQISAGSYETYRLEGDYTDSITESFAFRVNGSHTDAESFRDTISSKKTAITPSIVALLSDATTVSYELDYVDQEIPFDRGVVAVNGDPTALPPERFLGEPADGPMSIEATGHQLMLQHQLAGDWNVIGALSYRESNMKGLSSDTELATSRQLFLSQPERQLLNRQRRQRDYDTTDLSGRFELSGSFDMGSLTHNLIVGADAYDYELDFEQDRWRASPGSDIYTINPYAPVYGTTDPLPALTPLAYYVETQENWGVYFQDQVDLSDHWRVMAGIRYDDFEQSIEQKLSSGVASQSQTSVSPRLGVVYEISPGKQLYASYSEGFRPNGGSDANGNGFDPEESTSYEVGIKWGTADGKLSSTIALFRAEKSNILSVDPVNPGFSAALGEAESQGIEIDFNGQVTDTLFVWFSYAYVNAETANETINPDWVVAIPKGQSLINVPEHKANLTVTKDLSLMGSPASIGVSADYVDDRLGETIDPGYILPSYTLVKLFSSLSLTPSLKLQFEVDNLFEEEYASQSYSAEWTTPGEPRTFTVRAKYEL